MLKVYLIVDNLQTKLKDCLTKDSRDKLEKQPFIE